MYILCEELLLDCTGRGGDGIAAHAPGAMMAYELAHSRRVGPRLASIAPVRATRAQTRPRLPSD